LALIERFPTPATITALDREAFSAAAWPLIGRKVSKARLINDIYETASASTALPVPEDSAAITMFRMVIAQGRSLIRQRDEIERLAHARLTDDVDYQLLRNIPGIGPINALTILAEAGDLRRFNHHRQFLKFCGLDLATCQSGTFRGRTKLSKYGNARLRRTFWMAAQVAARQRDNSFRDKLGRYVAGHA
ncbi:transposase, partial [Klebsiella pneumoniae]